MSYDFPAGHRVRIPTSKPIGSIFATVRLRTKRSHNCDSRNTTLAMMFKLLQNVGKHWRKIRGFKKLEPVVNNVRFQDGEQVTDQPEAAAA